MCSGVTVTVSTTAVNRGREILHSHALLLVVQRPMRCFIIWNKTDRHSCFSPTVLGYLQSFTSMAGGQPAQTTDKTSALRTFQTRIEKKTLCYSLASVNRGGEEEGAFWWLQSIFLFGMFGLSLFDPQYPFFFLKALSLLSL